MELVEQLIELRTRHPADVTAVNGTVGIELAKSALPTAILMDINLPGIQRHPGPQDPPGGSHDRAHSVVIALSANAMPRDIEKGLEAGFFRYLTKPIIVKDFAWKPLNANSLSSRRMRRTGFGNAGDSR